ncbi:hypothetical protein HYU50_01710 [Candidatus Woesearchaeota archaeon]|nr:hypothetical protein [Candidatus Woesearchaeota archaeon]
MKHTLRITLLLALIFFITQVIGLAVTNKYILTREYIDPETNLVVKEIVPQDLPYKIERPEVQQSTSYIWIVVAILIGTLLLLLLIKYKKFNLWKLWFFLAVFVTMAIAFSAFIPQVAAAILAFILAILKIYRPTTIMQNLTEVFVYGGLAAIFVPIINIFAAFMLLLLISIYDIIAVNKTKHMITLAKFQAKSRVFAGFMFPYERKKGRIIAKPAKAEQKGTRIAVLGGGDVGFPLLFAGVVMKDLMLNNPEIIGFFKTLIIPFFVTLALLYLLFKGKQDKFYPAMPYLATGCIIGYLVILLVF